MGVHWEHITLHNHDLQPHLTVSIATDLPVNKYNQANIRETRIKQDSSYLSKTQFR